MIHKSKILIMNSKLILSKGKKIPSTLIWERPRWRSTCITKRRRSLWPELRKFSKSKCSRKPMRLKIGSKSKCWDQTNVENLKVLRKHLDKFLIKIKKGEETIITWIWTLLFRIRPKQLEKILPLQTLSKPSTALKIHIGQLPPECNHP